MPPNRYICFYPMDRKRGEDKNWYTLPMEERQRQMNEHGMIGRRYAGEVKQIITGSIGFDDWEWGVDLFADDPLVFKKLIYEMRFDHVSAVYALIRKLLYRTTLSGKPAIRFARRKSAALNSYYVVMQQILLLCHPERSRTIRETGRSAQSKDPYILPGLP